MERPDKIRLGDLLLQQGIITQKQLAFALEQHKSSGRRLGNVLLDNLFVAEETISEAIAWQFDIPYINLKFFRLNIEMVDMLPTNTARQFRVMVLDERESKLLVGMADPTDMVAYDAISQCVKRAFDVAVVDESKLLESIGCR